MNIITDNFVLMTAIIGWFAAQSLKIIIDVILNKKFNPERLMGAGGMPSSHSATVTALTTAIALKEGVSSSLFALSFMFAFIVMYDATGVRRETGKQSMLLNKILSENIFELHGEEFDKKLREYIGHTPLQVVCGAILGLIIAIILWKIYNVYFFNKFL